MLGRVKVHSVHFYRLHRVSANLNFSISISLTCNTLYNDIANTSTTNGIVLGPFRYNTIPIEYRIYDFGPCMAFHVRICDFAYVVMCLNYVFSIWNIKKKKQNNTLVLTFRQLISHQNELSASKCSEPIILWPVKSILFHRNTSLDGVLYEISVCCMHLGRIRCEKYEKQVLKHFVFFFVSWKSNVMR